MDFTLPSPTTDATDKGSLVRTLLAGLGAHGYGIRMGVMNAAAYGASQTRRRWFLSAAAKGVQLPPLPERTHSCQEAPHLLEIDVLSTAQRAANTRAQADHRHAVEQGKRVAPFKAPFTQKAQFSQRVHGHAPHRPSGIEDAISDLTPFEPEYPSPDEFDLPGPPDGGDRAKFRPQQVEAYAPFGYANSTAYSSLPLTTLQRAARIPEPFLSGSPDQLITQTVEDQYCPAMSPAAIAAIAHVGLKSQGQFGNYKDVPRQLRLFPPRLQAGDIDRDADLTSALVKSREGWMLRLLPGERVSPLRTALHFAGDHGARICPEQNRPLSVRELARCMGMASSVGFSL